MATHNLKPTPLFLGVQTTTGFFAVVLQVGTDAVLLTDAIRPITAPGDQVVVVRDGVIECRADSTERQEWR